MKRSFDRNVNAVNLKLYNDENDDGISVMFEACINSSCGSQDGALEPSNIGRCSMDTDLDLS